MSFQCYFLASHVSAKVTGQKGEYYHSYKPSVLLFAKPPIQILFEDQHTHDQFDIDVNEWIIESPDEDGCREYPVIWPGLITPPGWFVL